MTRTLKVFVEAWLIARRRSVDLILSVNGYPYGVIAAVVALLTGKGFHSWLIGSELHALTMRPWWWRLVKRASFLTVPGIAFEKRLRSIDYQGSIYQVTHGVDSERFRPNGTRDITLVFVGYLLPVKRVDIIIDAMELLVRDLPRTTLAVVGEGPLKSDLARRAKQAGIADAVQFAGFQRHPELWLRRSLLAIFPSEWEGMPFAMIEAMRCGAVPVISSVGSVEDLLVDGNNGRLLEERTAPALAALLLELLDDEALLSSMSRNAIASTAHMTYATVQQEWKDILASEFEVRSDAQ